MHGQALIHNPVGRGRGHPRGSGLVESTAKPPIHSLLEVFVLVLKLAYAKLAEVLVPVLVCADDPAGACEVNCRSMASFLRPSRSSSCVRVTLLSGLGSCSP